MPLYRWELIRRKKPLIGPQIHDISEVLYLPFDKDHEPYSVESHNPTQVLRLPFEDPPQEITYDRSGYGNNGTIYGATRVIGKVRNALLFDGVDDYVEVADDPTLNFGTGAFTVALWLKRHKKIGAWQTFISKDDGSTGWYIQFTSTNVIRFGTRIPDNADYLDGTTTITDFTYWSHIVAVRESDGTKRIYINAVQETPTSVHTVNVNNIQPLRLGQIVDIQYFPGFIDEVRIYNRELSLSEIKRLMNLRGV